MKKIIPLITGINIIILIIIGNILLGLAPNFRVDLSRTKIHSLSKVSEKTIKELDDIVTVKVFMSEDLPSSVKSISQDLKTVLGEMVMVNKNKFRVEYLDPLSSDEAKSEAAKFNISPLQFSTVKNDKFEVQNGYLGLAMVYGDKTEVLPVAGDVGNLEYFLISGVKKLVSTQASVIAIDEGLLQPGQSNIQYLRKYLQNIYTILDVKTASEEPLPQEAEMLLVVAPSEKLSEKAVTKIKDWVGGGKGLILLLDKITVNELMQGNKIGNLGWESILKESGMEVEEKLILDPSSSIANFRTQSGSFLTQYPYWVQVRPENINFSLPVMSGINSLVFNWVSPIKIEGDAKILFSSSQQSIASENFNDLSPVAKEQTSTDNQKFVLGAINTNNRKVALIADGDFIKDQFVPNSQQNLALAMNLVDYFSQDASLLTIRSKNLSSFPIKTLEEKQKGVIRWVNIISPVLILGVTALVSNIIRRKNNRRWFYDEI